MFVGCCSVFAGLHPALMVTRLSAGRLAGFIRLLPPAGLHPALTITPLLGFVAFHLSLII